MGRSNINFGEDANIVCNQMVDEFEDLLEVKNNLGYCMAVVINGDTEDQKDRCLELLAKSYATLDFFVDWIDVSVKEAKERANSGQ